MNEPDPNCMCRVCRAERYEAIVMECVEDEADCDFMMGTFGRLEHLEDFMDWLEAKQREPQFEDGARRVEQRERKQNVIKRRK